MSSALRIVSGCLVGTMLALAPAADAARFVRTPVNDAEDGQLIDGSIWQDKIFDATFSSLLLTLGGTGGSKYANQLTFLATELAANQTVSDVRLRVNMQGGVISEPLPIVITAALDFDPFVPAGAPRFALPRTQSSVTWWVTATWDSSGQLIAKWAESPDLSPIVNEVLARPGWESSVKAIALFLETPGVSGENFVRYDDTHPRWPAGGNAGILPARLIVNETYYDAFWGKELLCRPTPTSVEINVIPHIPTLLVVEWGTSPGTLDRQTTITLADATLPAQIRLTGFTPDTRYWYRLRFRYPFKLQWETGPVRSFVSLPEPGQPARICVTADAHVTNQAALGYWTMMSLLDSTLTYMGTYQPDGWHAWIDLGDFVVIRATRKVMDLTEAEQRYRHVREYVDRVGHSVPLLLVRGNHEEVNGWDYDGTPNNTAIWSGKMLLKWLPPPLPDGFYTGNTTPFPDLGLPGNYWSCRIGDLRVRALDPYLFSPRRPHNGHGETGGSLDGWDWQLGDAQYQWLHDDLVADPAPYSLVAIHHLTSTYTGVGAYYGRGGIEVVDWSIANRPTFEWGGQDETGADVIAVKRPNWLYGSVHDVLVQFGNQVVMKGHDHFHARQVLDGMVYVMVAKPDETGEGTGHLWGWRSATQYPPSLTVFQPNSGFLAVEADADAATYRYVQTYPTSGLGNVLDAFTVYPFGEVGAPLPPAETPRGTWIRGVTPNPARDGARLDFELGRGGLVRLALHDAAGRLVRELLHEEMPVGRHVATWDGRDSRGRRVGAGVYFAKLSSPERTDSVKMVVLR